MRFLVLLLVVLVTPLPAVADEKQCATGCLESPTREGVWVCVTWPKEKCDHMEFECRPSSTMVCEPAAKDLGSITYTQLGDGQSSSSSSSNTSYYKYR
jgi:hypothetical protein